MLEDDPLEDEPESPEDDELVVDDDDEESLDEVESPDVLELEEDALDRAPWSFL